MWLSASRCKGTFWSNSQSVFTVYFSLFLFKLQGADTDDVTLVLT